MAACYARLSIDDDLAGISVSIETQCHIMEAYCKENRIPIFDFYCDDGFTGTNFNRPQFQRMLNDAKEGKFNILLVKDLSRLGREYIAMGRYLEEIFPSLGIRVIALGDNFDSEIRNGDLDFLVPMKNLYNQFYPADTSRKVRQALKMKAGRGEYIGSAAPYGYKKDPEDYHKLVICQNAADTVKQIFEWIVYCGYGYTKVARTLSRMKVPKPSCSDDDGSLCVSIPAGVDPYDWNLCSVRSIVMNEIYTGTIVSGKREKYSYKSKKIIRNSREKCIVTENAVPPIITRELWLRAQEHVRSRRRETSSGIENIFAGLLRCDKCGKVLGLGSAIGNERYYRCETYKKKGKNYCSSHYTLYRDLYIAVLNDLRETIKCAKQHQADIDARAALAALERSKNLDRTLARIKELESKIRSSEERYDRLYEDRLNGVIPIERFLDMSKKEQDSIQAFKLEHERLVRGQEASNGPSYDEFLKRAEEFGEIRELNSYILNSLIDKIVVGDRYKIDGQYHQDITIYYKFDNPVN